MEASTYYTFKFIPNDTKRLAFAFFIVVVACEKVCNWSKEKQKKMEKSSFLFDISPSLAFASHTHTHKHKRDYLRSKVFRFRIWNSHYLNLFTRIPERKKWISNGFCLLTTSSPFNGCDTLVSLFERVKRILLLHTYIQSIQKNRRTQIFILSSSDASVANSYSKMNLKLHHNQNRSYIKIMPTLQSNLLPFC